MAAAIPFIIPQYFDNSGRPLSSGTVEFYKAGTNIPAATYTDSTGLIPNTNPVQLDAAGRAPIFMAPGSYKIVLKDRNGVTIWTQDKIKPADGGGGGLVDGDYVYEGYSQLLNGQFGPSTGLADTLARIIRIVYTAASISLTGSTSGTIREKGASVAGVTLTSSVTKRSNPIAAVRFYRDGTLINTQTAGGAIPDGGVNTHAYGTAFSDNTAFTAQVDDIMVGADGPTTVTSNIVTYTFVYPYYYGCGANNLTTSQVAALTKNVVASSNNLTVTLTALAGQHTYFAYPASYGALTSILDVNGFEVLPSWTGTTGNIVGLDTTSQSYRIYKGNNPLAAGSYQFTFKR